MISQEAREAFERLVAEQAGPQLPLAQRRRAWEAAARLTVLPRDARFSQADADGVPAEWMDMPRVWRDRVLILMHGGGFVAGSPRTHRRLAANLGRMTHMRVLTPDYRLAPEQPFPAAVQDGLRAYGWLLRQGVEATNIMLCGDEAGANLVMGMLLALRRAKARLPRAAMLISPWVDLSCAGTSFGAMRQRDPVVRRPALLEMGGLYAGRLSVEEPFVSPLKADLAGLPPLLIHVGANEVLLDDARGLAERVRAAGGEVALRIFDGMWHAFHTAGTGVPEARQAIDEMGSFARGQFARGGDTGPE